jgi:hypothetical protein
MVPNDSETLQTLLKDLNSRQNIDLDSIRATSFFTPTLRFWRAKTAKNQHTQSLKEAYCWGGRICDVKYRDLPKENRWI